MLKDPLIKLKMHLYTACHFITCFAWRWCLTFFLLLLFGFYMLSPVNVNFGHWNYFLLYDSYFLHAIANQHRLSGPKLLRWTFSFLFSFLFWIYIYVIYVICLLNIYKIGLFGTEHSIYNINLIFFSSKHIPQLINLQPYMYGAIYGINGKPFYFTLITLRGH